MDERDAPHDGRHGMAVSGRQVSNRADRCQPIDLLTRASEAFTRRLAVIHTDQWTAPTRARRGTSGHS